MSGDKFRHIYKTHKLIIGYRWKSEGKNPTWTKHTTIEGFSCALGMGSNSMENSTVIPSPPVSCTDLRGTRRPRCRCLALAAYYEEFQRIATTAAPADVRRDAIARAWRLIPVAWLGTTHGWSLNSNQARADADADADAHGCYVGGSMTDWSIYQSIFVCVYTPMNMLAACCRLWRPHSSDKQDA
jgi:hypothetical protein